MHIGVCIRAKDEQKIICDWVSHYLKLGFDKIIIYDNMSNPSIYETLSNKNLINDKVEIIIDSCPHSNQSVIYQETIDKNKHLDWLLLCDADEFLWIKDGSIKDFLSKFSDDTCSILVNWLIYGTSGKLHYNPNKTIFQQFKMREEYNHFWNSFGKCIIRPKLINKVGSVHQTYNPNFLVKNVYNNTIQLKEDLQDRDPNFSDNTPVLLVHYMTLDFQSMINKNKKNINGWLLEQNCNKYTIEWYKAEHYGFKDSIKDIRMLKYV